MQGTFTGKAELNKIDSKFPYYSEGKTKDGAKYHRFNLAIVDNKNNRIMTELFGMVQKEIKTMDTDNNKISIEWEDRDDKAIMDKVANYKKNVFSFVGDERKEFISTYDAVEYLKDHADDLKGKNVGVTVGVSLNVYKGKISNRYEIRNIYKMGLMGIMGLMSLASCTDYLDKEERSIIDASQPYLNFRNFQGFFNFHFISPI